MIRTRLASFSGFILIAIPTAVRGVRLDVPRVEDFIRRWNVAATVIGDYVYIDGGEITQFENGTIDGFYPCYQVNSTLSINISTSWTTSNVSIRTIEKPNPPRSSPVLWSDKEGNGGFYSWGGVFSLSRFVTRSEMWRFSADGRGGGSWSLVQDFANPEAFKSFLSAESAAYANTDDKGFSIGGWVSPGSQQGIEQVQIVPGMVSFDMRTKEISNGTTNDADPTKSPIETLIGGQAHFLPSDTGTRSETGLILLLGGHKSFVDRQIAQEDSPGFDLRNLTFFDPDSRERYWQITTGDIPPYPRVDFCVTGFATQGGGYDVFIFGGRNAGRGYYDDAYILSLPGFEWIRVPTPPGGTRAHHRCVSLGSQVLSIGGIAASHRSVDPAPQGLLIFDMTAQVWKDNYDAKAKEYVRAKRLEDWYQRGGMDKVDWSSERVKALFVTDTGAAPPGSPPGKQPETTGEPKQPGSEENLSTTQIPVVAIAGAGAGGMLVLAILVTLVIWMVYRHKKAKKEKDNRAQWPRPLKQSAQSPIMEMPIYRQESDRLCGYWEPSRSANNISSNSARMSMQRVEMSVNNDHWELSEAPKAQSVHGSRRVSSGVGVRVGYDPWNLQDRGSF